MSYREYQAIVAAKKSIDGAEIVVNGPHRVIMGRSQYIDLALSLGRTEAQALDMFDAMARLDGLVELSSCES